MIALDTTFLLDYLDGIDATASFLEANEQKPVYAPALVLFEVYRGAARTGGSEAIDEVASGLDWVEPLPMTDATAREAALIEAELLDAGTPINLGDALIAGICRHNGACIVTRDGHYEQVDGLDVQTY